MAPRRRCPVCQSKQWYKEPSSGLIACSEGHVLQNYRNEAAEADDMGQHTLRKRTLKSSRQKKEKGSKADPKLYHGARGRYHYFQCLQLLLRKQVLALIALWELPAEYEVGGEDIWTLHLSLLPNPPPAEPYLYSQDTLGETRSSTPKIEKLPAGRSQTPSDDDHTSQEEDQLRESSSELSDATDGDPEMAELLHENSASGSSDEDDVDTSTKPTPTQQLRKRGSLDRYDSPASNIAVLVLACWTMRIPVMYDDFRKIIESHELPYFDPVRLFPGSLSLHLTKHTKQMLSPHHAPPTLLLHRLTSRLAKLIYSSHGILTPEVNAAPILWRVTHILGGTPMLYNLTKTLARVLSLPLTLHHSLAPSLPRGSKRDPDSHKYDNVPPEVAFVATGIIVLKMVYGFDGKSRLPAGPNDPICSLPTLGDYLPLVRELESAGSKSQDEIFRSDTHMSVGDLDAPMMDEYLDFCERALLRPGIEDQNVIHDYFPLARDVSTFTANRTPVVYPKLRGNEWNEDATPSLHPGLEYTIYNPQDVLGSFPDEYKMVLSRGAGRVGVSEDYLSGVIENYERRIVRWWEAEKRRSREVKKEEEEGE